MATRPREKVAVSRLWSSATMGTAGGRGRTTPLGHGGMEDRSRDGAGEREGEEWGQTMVWYPRSVDCGEKEGGSLNCGGVGELREGRARS